MFQKWNTWIWHGTARVTIIENEDSSAEIEYEAVVRSAAVAGVGQKFCWVLPNILSVSFFSTLKKSLTRIRSKWKHSIGLQFLLFASINL